jgi:predicted TIM-barrel fold metal-dependent hydrolase
MGTTARPIDADNHYYEPLDAFTRHLDPMFRHRGVRVFQEGRRVEVVIGGRVNRFIPNPTFDPVIVPGALDLQFRGQLPEGVDPSTIRTVEPISPAYRDREARLSVMDDQGLEAVLLFPTLGCGVEEALKHDVPATVASLHAFNRWLEDDWGYSHLDRILAVPMISLADPQAAIVEVDRVLGLGARAIHVRPAPVPTGGAKGRALGDPAHDPVWARLTEADVPVALHLGDSGYNAMLGSAWGGASDFAPFLEPDPLGQVIIDDHAIHDAVASLVVPGALARHPDLQVMSIENGSDWVFPLVKRLTKLANMAPGLFADAPLDLLRHHLWVAPYYEDDVSRLADTIGVERVLFGSDWPHGEGLADPASWSKELEAAGFDEGQIERIMRTNSAELLGLG